MKERKSIRKKDHDYSSEGYYFITINTQDRNNLFGEIVDGKIIPNKNHEICTNLWKQLSIHYQNITLDEFIIMPDHLHGIIIIDHESERVRAIHELPQRNELPQSYNLNDAKYRRKMLIPKIIGRFKMQSAKQINIHQNTPETKIWQRNYYDRIIRSEKEYINIKNYIQNNPLNATNNIDL